MLKAVVKGGLGQRCVVKRDILQGDPKTLEEFDKSTLLGIAWRALVVAAHDYQFTKSWKDEGSGETFRKMGCVR